MGPWHVDSPASHVAASPGGGSSWTQLHLDSIPGGRESGQVSQVS